MLTVISHRGQETFNVPVMGCMNSVAYVQSQIDRILRPVKAFASAYIDDVVSGAKSLPEHLSHLRQLFQLFVDYNIAISPNKTFLGYPNVNLLGRRVDSFGMATAEDKIKVRISHIGTSDIAYPHFGSQPFSAGGWQFCIINRPAPGEHLGNNQGIQSILDLNFNMPNLPVLCRH